MIDLYNNNNNNKRVIDKYIYQFACIFYTNPKKKQLMQQLSIYENAFNNNAKSIQTISKIIKEKQLK